jgi:hypothetical protein
VQQMTIQSSTKTNCPNVAGNVWSLFNAHVKVSSWRPLDAKMQLFSKTIFSICK